MRRGRKVPVEEAVAEARRIYNATRPQPDRELTTLPEWRCRLALFDRREARVTARGEIRMDGIVYRSPELHAYAVTRLRISPWGRPPGEKAGRVLVVRDDRDVRRAWVFTEKGEFVAVATKDGQPLEAGRPVSAREWESLRRKASAERRARRKAWERVLAAPPEPERVFADAPENVRTLAIPAPWEKTAGVPENDQMIDFGHPGKTPNGDKPGEEALDLYSPEKKEKEVIVVDEKSVCRVCGKEKPLKARGMCAACYQRDLAARKASRRTSEKAFRKDEPFAERETKTVAVNFERMPEVWEALNRAAFAECRTVPQQIVYAVIRYLEVEKFLPPDWVETRTEGKGGDGRDACAAH